MEFHKWQFYERGIFDVTDKPTASDLFDSMMGSASPPKYEPEPVGKYNTSLSYLHSDSFFLERVRIDFFLSLSILEYEMV